MVVNQETCDTLRLETLNKLDGADPSPQMVDVVNIYAKTVDNRDGINNYKADIQFITKNCTKMANPRLWKPVSSTVNLDKLMLKLKLDWPRKKDCQAIIDTLDEIEQSYSDKIRPASVANTKKYTTHEERQVQQQQKQQQQKSQGFNSAKDTARNPILDDERLKNIDPNIAERILNEVIDKKQNIKWDDIAGLRFAKTAINEIVVYPMLNPSVFRGLLAPAKGLLLFGPPGTGKTLIGKCIANESRATFFAISASSLTSKWVGEGEKMVRALFAVARCLQPSVVFIDEIDSMLTHRTDNEHDSSRRMKTEFLVQFDGVSTETEDRILIIGATNRPQELDEAARRRFTKRLYIPLPDKNARAEIIERLLIGQNHSLTKECAIEIASKAEGYSGADMTNLCKEAAMEPIRTIIRKDPSSGVQNLESASVPPISKNDFENALKQVKASVSNADLNLYLDWNRNYGSVGNEVIL